MRPPLSPHLAWRALGTGLALLAFVGFGLWQSSRRPSPLLATSPIAPDIATMRQLAHIIRAPADPAEARYAFSLLTRERPVMLWIHGNPEEVVRAVALLAYLTWPAPLSKSGGHRGGYDQAIKENQAIVTLNQNVPPAVPNQITVGGNLTLLFARPLPHE